MPQIFWCCGLDASWMLLPHKAVVACRDWEACKWLVWAATAEASIQQKLTQALLESVPLLLDAEQDSSEVSYPVFWAWTMSPNPQKIFTRQMEKILSCDRTQAWPECTNLIFLSFHILPFPWKIDQWFPQATCGTPHLKVVQVTLIYQKSAKCKSPQRFLVPAMLKKSAYCGFMPYIRRVSYLLLELCPKLHGKQSSRCKPEHFGDGTRKLKLNK